MWNRLLVFLDYSYPDLFSIFVLYMISGSHDNNYNFSLRKSMADLIQANELYLEPCTSFDLGEIPL